ncbi:hypothetical protein OQA88_9304 [Cercophora sp. LCS_1]
MSSYESFDAGGFQMNADRQAESSASQAAKQQEAADKKAKQEKTKKDAEAEEEAKKRAAWFARGTGAR